MVATPEDIAVVAGQMRAGEARERARREAAAAAAGCGVAAPMDTVMVPGPSATAVGLGFDLAPSGTPVYVAPLAERPSAPPAPVYVDAAAGTYGSWPVPSSALPAMENQPGPGLAYVGPQGGGRRSLWARLTGRRS